MPRLTPPNSSAGTHGSSVISATAPSAAVQDAPIEVSPAARAPARGFAPLTPGIMLATWLAAKTVSRANGSTAWPTEVTAPNTSAAIVSW